MLSDAKLTINSRIVETQVTQSDDDEVVPAKKSMWDFLEEKTESASSSRNTDQNELEQYLGEAKLPRSADPLEYWKDNKKFPKLKKFAQEFLAAPPSSVRSERVFSVSGLVNSDRRNRLLPEFSEQLVLIHDNFLLLQ